MKNLTFLFLLISLFLSKADAQRTITGMIYLENNGEAIGATVVVDGDEGIGTATEWDGTFLLEVPETAKDLKISYTGYHTQITSIVDTNYINVTLEEGPVLVEVIIPPYHHFSRKYQQEKNNSYVEKCIGCPFIPLRIPSKKPNY